MLFYKSSILLGSVAVTKLSLIREYQILEFTISNMGEHFLNLLDIQMVLALML